MKKLMVRIKPNQCPSCGGELVLTEVEKTTFPLDDTGVRENYFDQDYYEVFLKCTECGHVYDADKKGEHFFISNTLPIVEKKENGILSFNPFMKY